MRQKLLVLCFALPAFSYADISYADKYRVTASEKAACTYDAVRFCSSAYPDEDALISCMRQNHSSLTSTCAVAFDAGMKRRRL